MTIIYRGRAKEKLFFSVLISIVIFFISLFLLNFYVNGDQSHYIKFWSDASSLNFFDTYSLQASSLGSREPLYSLLVNFFSGWVPKNLVVASTNTLIAFLCCRWMFRHNVNLIVIISLFGIFYFWVVFLAAERLKFAFLFLLLSTVYVRGSFLFYGAALLTHISVIILILARYSNEIINLIYDLFIRLKVGKKKILYFLISLIGIGLIGTLLSAHIYNKLSYLLQDFSFSYIGVIKGLIFWFMALVYCKGRYQEVLTSGFVLMIPVLLLGPDRTIIFYYIFFLYYALQYNRGLNLGVIITILYFGFGTFSFVENVLNYGDGFYFTEKVQLEASNSAHGSISDERE